MRIGTPRLDTLFLIKNLFAHPVLLRLCQEAQLPVVIMHADVPMLLDLINGVFEQLCVLSLPHDLLLDFQVHLVDLLVDKLIGSPARLRCGLGEIHLDRGLVVDFAVGSHEVVKLGFVGLVGGEAAFLAEAGAEIECLAFDCGVGASAGLRLSGGAGLD
jgi:hypothetical protein